MAFMCMECYEVYDCSMEFCPKSGCDGSVFEIDELMLPTIKMLNEKGYLTEYCCSGHVYDNCCGAYVCLIDFMTEVLDEEEKQKMMSMLPKSWKMSIDNYNRINFRCYLNDNLRETDVVAYYEELLNANMSFLRFVEELPYLEY